MIYDRESEKDKGKKQRARTATNVTTRLTWRLLFQFNLRRCAPSLGQGQRELLCLFRRDSLAQTSCHSFWRGLKSKNVALMWKCGVGLRGGRCSLMGLANPKIEMCIDGLQQ